MISHQHKCIFIHIPKCAGTSIEKALGHLDGHSGRGGQDHRSISELENTFSSEGALSLKDKLDKVLGRGRFKIRKGANPNNLLTVTKSQYHDYFKFTIIRNPWARYYSLYRNIMRDEQKLKRRNYPSDLSFSGFLHHQTENGLLKPQTYWLKSLDGSINFDFIGRFENLREDFEKACVIMGINGIELPHIVKGTGESYQSAYDTQTIAIVAKTCHEEIELFGYSFGAR